MDYRAFAIGLTLVLAPTAGPAVASEQPGLTMEAWQVMRRFVKPGNSAYKARKNALHLFWHVNRDGGGVSEWDYHLADRMNAARIRANLMVGWLQMDLDGDGEVTRSELRSRHSQRAHRSIREGHVVRPPTEAEVAEKLEELVAVDLAADANQDGRVTFAEALEAARARQAERQEVIRHAIPLALDGDGNGSVEEAEFIEIVERTLARVDANDDGTLSAAEVSLFDTWGQALVRSTVEVRGPEAALSSCLLDVPAEAAVVAYGAYNGGMGPSPAMKVLSRDAFPEIAVRAPALEGGVSLVLTAYEPTLWVIDPATVQHVRSVLLMGYHSQVIANLPLSIPLLMSSYEGRRKTPCESYANAYESGENLESLKRLVLEITGREIDHFAGKSTATGFPLGEAAPHPEIVGPIRTLRVLAAPDELVGPKAVEALVRSGMLRRATEEDISAWLEAATERSPTGHLAPIPRSWARHRNLYTALGNLRLPKGLEGRHSIGLIVPADVTHIEDPGAETVYFDVASGEKCTGVCPKVSRP